MYKKFLLLEARTTLRAIVRAENERQILPRDNFAKTINRQTLSALHRCLMSRLGATLSRIVEKRTLKT